MSVPPASKWILIMLAASYFSLMTLFFMHMDSATIYEWTLLKMNSTQISSLLLIDLTSIIMISTVSIVSFNVLLFSHYYLSGPDQKKFYLLLLLFILSMVLFSASGNLMMMMMGWDGLGITSFLLVAHYQSSVAAGSSMVTMFTNRIGDVLIIISMFFLIQTAHWNIPHLLFLPLKSAFLSLIFLAAATKSAHIPFSLWLPEAMAAPTPVSALVHSSTLVTAGVVLTLRLSYMMKDAPAISMTMWVIGLLTTFKAGAVASHMKDPKKIIAYSTMSQLGMMSMSIALMMPQLALLHLVTHAMFKALMFITMGVTIAMNKHKQSMMSNNSPTLTLPGLSFKVAVLALNAFPFTAGFFSKDLILESSMIYSTELILLSIYLPTSLTAFYSVRLIRQTLISKNKSPQMTSPTQNSHSLSLFPQVATFTQTFLALTSGALLTLILPPYNILTMTTINSIIILSMTFFGLYLIMVISLSAKLSSFIMMQKTSSTSMMYSVVSMWRSLEKLNTSTFNYALKSYKYLDKGLMKTPLTLMMSVFSGSSKWVTANKMTSLSIILASPLFILFLLLVI